MSTMAWYPLPQQSGGAMSAGDEFFDNQSAGWPLWSYDEDAAEEHPEPERPSPLEPEQPARPTDDIFLSQFSDEEMRRMDGEFEALDMFPGSMHRLLSYENMLSGVLTGSSEGQGARLEEQSGVDTMDTCGFPLFSHDLQRGQDARPAAAEPVDSKETVEMLPIPAADDAASMDKAGMMGAVKRSRPAGGDGEEGALGFEALVLEELEDVVFQLTKRTRICLRDAFFRLADISSEASKRGAAGGAAAEAGPSGRGFRPPADGGDASRVSAAAAGGTPERETNAIDRTVADLTLKRPPLPAHLELELHHGLGDCRAGDSGAEAQSGTTSWATRA